MARASAAAAVRTARDVLERATGLFADRGYPDVSLDDVAEAAGVTRGAVYHHFGSKPGLFVAVAESLQAGIAEAVVVAAEAAGDDPSDRLRAGCHAFLDAITAGRAARVLLVDAVAVLGWAEWRRLDAQSSGAHLRDALAGVGTAADVLDALTAQLSGAMNEAALWLVEHDGAEARAAAHEALDRLLTAALGPDPGRS